MALRLDVQITPNAPRSEIIGWLANRLKIKIKAPPVEGKANAELTRFLAAHLGLRANAVSVIRGETGRMKTLQIEAGEETLARLPAK